jgi:hypothetical protein
MYDYRAAYPADFFTNPEKYWPVDKHTVKPEPTPSSPFPNDFLTHRNEYTGKNTTDDGSPCCRHCGNENVEVVSVNDDGTVNLLCLNCGIEQDTDIESGL